ncbi:hypothetical protein [Streptomyces tremellae]|uniref:Asparagine synthetase domain-containing protein n=1 Tax=Streptomyces tremellae TaxID=1124239 RepID=A0ABP7E7E9_9ACTN
MTPSVGATAGGEGPAAHGGHLRRTVDEDRGPVRFGPSAPDPGLPALAELVEACGTAARRSAPEPPGGGALLREAACGYWSRRALRAAPGQVAAVAHGRAPAAAHRAVLAAGALAGPPEAGRHLYADFGPLRARLATVDVTDSMGLEEHLGERLGTPVYGGHRFNDELRALRVRLPRAPRLGVTPAQRLESVIAGPPLGLPHVARALSASAAAPSIARRPARHGAGESRTAGGSGGSGITGSARATGTTGITGITGITDGTGTTGSSGITASARTTGITGITGITDGTGATGGSGITGSARTTGITGITDGTGSSGSSGSSGSTEGTEAQ